MMEEPSNIIFTFIFSVLSFLGLCNDATVTPPLYSDGGLELVLALPPEVADQEIEQAITVLTERLAFLSVELHLDAGSLVLNLPTDSADMQARIVQLATQVGELGFQLVKESSAQVENLTLADLEEVVFTGEIIATATALVDEFSSFVVEFELLPDYQADFETFTADHIGRRLAVTLDGEVLLAPFLNSIISESGVISGLDSWAAAEDLARLLDTGPLPFPLVLESVEFVD